MSESFEIDIHASQSTYQVIIGQGLVADLLKDTSLFVILDEHLMTLFPGLQHEKAILISAREEEKTLETVAKVIERLRELGANRGGQILAIGGGIIQDVSTFVASSYMRGIRWTYCPTTLLGMVDSCIGGKSSINVGRFKNIAGNFFPPEKIIIDTVFCQTLPREELIAGLFEAVKICYADRNAAFDAYLSVGKPEQVIDDSGRLQEIIRLSLTTKKAFIEEDEFDQGVRLLLNFGHTFGHALEGASHFEISHGIAVGMGMLVSLYFSEDTGRIQSKPPRISALETYVLALMRQVGSVGATLSRVEPQQALGCFKSDKKHTDSHYVVIAYQEDGGLERTLIPITSESEAAILRAFRRLKEELNEI